MALKMTDSEVGGTSVVTLDGRIVLGEESQALRQKLKSLIAEGNKKIILNMDNIKNIDSAGLGILVAAHVNAKLQRPYLLSSPLGTKPQETLQIPNGVSPSSKYSKRKPPPAPGPQSNEAL